jgi:hypothetical protein
MGGWVVAGIEAATSHIEAPRLERVGQLQSRLRAQVRAPRQSLSK